MDRWVLESSLMMIISSLVGSGRMDEGFSGLRGELVFPGCPPCIRFQKING